MRTPGLDAAGRAPGNRAVGVVAFGGKRPSRYLIVKSGMWCGETADISLGKHLQGQVEHG